MFQGIRVRAKYAHTAVIVVYAILTVTILTVIWVRPKATVSKMETVQIEGKRRVNRALEYYNLDLVLSIGYRVNSRQATHFRQWATKTLREHITQGYTINPRRIIIKIFLRQLKKFEHCFQEIRKLLSLIIFLN